MGPEKPDIVPEQGSLYSFDWPDRFVPQKRLAPVSISNGLAWSDKDDLMYFIDSPLREIHVFDFDVVSGDISKYDKSVIKLIICCFKKEHIFIHSKL